jgi:hypothetical protein
VAPAPRLIEQRGEQQMGLARGVWRSGHAYIST